VQLFPTTTYIATTTRPPKTLSPTRHALVDRLIRRPFVRQRICIVVRRVLSCNNVSFSPYRPKSPLPGRHPLSSPPPFAIQSPFRLYTPSPISHSPLSPIVMLAQHTYLLIPLHVIPSRAINRSRCHRLFQTAVPLARRLSWISPRLLIIYPLIYAFTLKPSD